MDPTVRNPYAFLRQSTRYECGANYIGRSAEDELWKVVARGGPIREANQDSKAARRVRIGLSRSESMDSLCLPFGRS